MSEDTTADPTAKSLRVRCWDGAFRAFATAYMFERRAGALRVKLRWLAFLGIAVPVLVGGLVMTYGLTSPAVAKALPWAGALGVLQLLMSAVSLTSDWSGGLQTSTERIWVNHALAKDFEAIARTPPADPAAFQSRFDILTTQEKESERTDYQLHLSDREKRAGYRAASRHFRRACTACEQVAYSVEPASDCPVCGEPSRWWSRRTDWKTLRKSPMTIQPPSDAPTSPTQ
jgi:mobilome CxxCx(11)CxxC protein